MLKAQKSAISLSNLGDSWRECAKNFWKPCPGVWGFQTPEDRRFFDSCINVDGCWTLFDIQ